ncbi:hypothetical protein BZG36_05705, partial [Bifiguratus adelaidae]
MEFIDVEDISDISSVLSASSDEEEDMSDYWILHERNYNENFCIYEYRTFEEGEVRTDVNIRFEFAYMNMETFFWYLEQVISDNVAPPWFHSGDNVFSDEALNKTVVYHRNEFEFTAQEPPRTQFHTTMISGEQEIHSGIICKIISHHQDMIYGHKDCLIQCMNEQFPDRRRKPSEIYRMLWPNGPAKDIHTPRHLRKVAETYRCRLCILNVEDVKVGKVVGILDYFKEAEELNENIGISELYYDLETVGEDQRVYAYSIKTKYFEKTIVNDDLDWVEKELRRDIANLLESQIEPYVAFAWNGSRFDSYVMMKILKHNNRDFYVSNIIINSGNELLNFTATANNKKITFRDPKKLFDQTLEGASNILGILSSKNEQDHDMIEKAYYEGQFKEYLSQEYKKIRDYVRQDVRILQNVTTKIKELYGLDNLPIRSLLTRSMAASLLWKSQLKNIDLLKDVTFDPYDKRNEIINNAIGGRSQCVKSGVFYDVGGIDVKSMYPY